LTDSPEESSEISQLSITTGTPADLSICASPGPRSSSQQFAVSLSIADLASLSDISGLASRTWQFAVTLGRRESFLSAIQVVDTEGTAWTFAFLERQARMLVSEREPESQRGQLEHHATYEHN
jgi:hypothetical protein